MNPPIAFTYDADTHCPPCALRRFGHDTDEGGSLRPWPPESARDGEGNTIGAIAPWDEWCSPERDTWTRDPVALTESAHCTLLCGTCHATIEDHVHTRSAA